MKRLILASVVVAAAALPARPVRACDVAVFPVTLDGPPLVATTAPAGSVWWLDARFDDELAAVEMVSAATGAIVSIPVDALVSRGPRHVAIRVPADGLVGDAYRLLNPASGTRLVVGTGEVPVDVEAPVIMSLDAIPGSEVYGVSCSIGFPPREEAFFTTVTVDIATPDGLSADDVLLDVWVLEPGAAIPDDVVDRAFDAVPASWTGVASAGGAAFQVRQLGSFDVHVRATDPRTGRSSSTERIGVINDRPPEERAPDFGRWSWGCGATSPSSPSSPSTLALVALFALALRKARPSRRERA